MTDPASTTTTDAAAAGTRWRQRALVGLAMAALLAAPVSVFATQAACILLVVVALPDFDRLWRSERALVVALALVAGSWLLSWTFSPRGPAAFEAAKDAWLLALLPAVVATRDVLWPRRHWLIGALALGVVAATVGSLVQLATGQDLIRGIDLAERWGPGWRPTGFYRSAMTLGGMAALSLAAFIAVALAPSTPRRVRLLAAVAAAVALALLILSGSRSYQLALPLLVLLWGLARGRKGMIAAWIVLVIATSVVVQAGTGSLGAGRFALPDVAFEPYPDTPTLYTATFDAKQDQRVALWFVGLECIHDHPWTGTGRGAAGYVWTMRRYRERFRQRTGVELVENHLHNNVLQILVETGVIGLFAVGALVLVLVWRWLEAWRTQAGALAPGPTIVAGVVIALLVSGITEYSLGDLEIAMLASLLIGLGHPPAPARIPLSSAARVWFSWRRFGARGVWSRSWRALRGGPGVVQRAWAVPAGTEDTFRNALQAQLRGFLANPDARLRFPPAGDPRVSIVIPTHNTDFHVLEALQSVLAHTTDVTYEVILVDDASTDRTPELCQRLANVRVIRLDENHEFVRACNVGAATARGEFLVLLNSDTAVTPDWLASLLRTARRAPDIGAVCGKLVWPDGRLQVAGGIVWRDGGTLSAGNGDDPHAAPWNHVREVDFGSAACLLLRADAFRACNGGQGFDPAFAPAYYEDVDLAFCLRAAGYRTLYQPRSLVIHFELGSRQPLDTARRCMANQREFTCRHAEALAAQCPWGEVWRARDRSPGPRVLCVLTDAADDETRDRALADAVAGWTVLPAGSTRIPGDVSEQLQQAGVEVLDPVPASAVAAVLRARPGAWDDVRGAGRSGDPELPRQD